MTQRHIRRCLIVWFLLVLIEERFRLLRPRRETRPGLQRGGQHRSRNVSRTRHVPTLFCGPTGRESYNVDRGQRFTLAQLTLCDGQQAIQSLALCLGLRERAIVFHERDEPVRQRGRTDLVLESAQ